MPTPEEWAWLAGVYEGEGCASFAATARHSAVVSIAMNDRDVIERINALVPCPSAVRERPYLDGRKTRYEWWLSRKVDITFFLEGVLPWLGERRTEKARAVLARLAGGHGSENWGVRCRHGHLLDEENTYVHPVSGRRSCRACIRDSARRAYRRKLKLRVPVIFGVKGDATSFSARELLTQ